MIASDGGDVTGRTTQDPSGSLFGSDVVADVLRELDVPFIAINPGASYRGLHDSIVNRLGNRDPEMLICLHEEHAVAIAQGYAKVTGKPMAVALHANVGLMHATMAIFNAWCDRVPMIILGATGAVDAAERRPWIEWIHTARDQASIVRDYVKWDDQPVSPAASREAMLRGAWLTRTAPMAPVYIVLGVELQERPAAALPPITARRYMPSVSHGPAAEDVRRILEMMEGARSPLILAGRVSRSETGWAERVRIAEAYGARVATDMRIACSFPTDHPLHVGAMPNGLGAGIEPIATAIREADLILSLDWLDLSGLMRTALDGKEVSAKVIQVSLDHVLHNGWSFDHMGLPAVDHMVAADPDLVVAAIAASACDRMARRERPPVGELLSPPLDAGAISVAQLGHAVRRATQGRDVSLLQLPLSWNLASWHMRHPLDYLGTDGGGGIGSGPGLSIGAALALRSSGRLPVAIFGDGNFMMGCSAVWTAVHHRIAALFVIANNQTYYNDELHQERVALHRHRPVENKWVGQRMTDPVIDIAMVARAQGATAFGPVECAADLEEVLKSAVVAVDAGETVVVDVRVLPGYAV